MNPRPDPGPLLADVLAESAPDGFESGLLAATLRGAARRRRVRRIRRVATTGVALVVGAFSSWWLARPAVPSPACPVVLTRPLSSTAMVHTRSFPTANLVGTVAFAGTVTTSSGGVPVPLLGDRELLALTAAHPAVLVRLDAHTQALQFVHPGDAAGFPLD